jgi:hypothetical protein
VHLFGGRTPMSEAIRDIIYHAAVITAGTVSVALLALALLLS